MITTPYRSPASATLVALALAVLLASCASGPAEQGHVALPADDIVILPPETGEETAYTARLQEAEQLLAARQLLPAASILRDLDSGKLTASERVRSRLLRRHAARTGGAAGSLATSPRAN